MNNQINLPGSELKTALGGLSKLIGRKTTLPVLSCVRISRHEDGLVTLQATDLTGFATYRLKERQMGEPLDVLVPIEHLIKVSKSGSGKWDIALLEEGKTTKLRYFIGDTPAIQPVNTVDVTEWPPVPAITADSTALPAAFGEALKQAMACCSQDQSRYVLRGACLDARDKKAHYIVGTNGRFLYSANSFSFPFKDAVIVPDSKFINGSGLLDGEPCAITIQPGSKHSDAKHIRLQNDRWQFVTREIEGQYPNWKQVVPAIDAKWTQVQLSPAAIEQLLIVIPRLPGQGTENQTIRLRFDKVLWVDGKGKDDKDWTKIAIPDAVIRQGKASWIAIPRQQLLAALKFGLDAIAVQDELTPMIISKGGKQMVLMPVRPESATAATQPNASSVTENKSDQKEGPNNPNERKEDMSKTSATTAPTQAKTETITNESTVKTVVQQIEKIKGALKGVVNEFGEVLANLKLAEKEKKASDREVQSIRESLQEIQRIKI